MALGSGNIQNITTKLSDLQSSHSSLVEDLSSEANALADVNEDIARTSSETVGLFEDAASDQNQIDALNREIIAVNDQRNADNVAISDKAIADTELAKQDLQTKIHLQKFVDESGMCGMGMGMGNTYGECGAIDLTAEEILALKDELLDIGDSQDSFDSNFESITNVLNEKLADSGSSCTTGKDEDGTSFLEITRSDGSSVKIYDANGNGALDNKDYDFCQAIQKAQEILDKMNEKIEAINTKAMADVDANNRMADDKIDGLKARIAELEASRDTALDKGNYNKDTVLPNLEAEASGIEANYDSDKAELADVEDQIEETEASLAKEKADEVLANAEADETDEAGDCEKTDEALVAGSDDGLMGDDELELDKQIV